MNPTNNFFLDIIANHLTYGNTDKWLLMDDSLYGIGMIAGFNTRISPIRLGFGFNQNSNKKETKSLFTYISVGYDYDAFFLSRR